MIGVEADAEFGWEALAAVNPKKSVDEDNDEKNYKDETHSLESRIWNLGFSV